MDHMKFKTPNMVEENIEKIKALFPSVMTEGKDENGNIKEVINFEALKQLLSKDVIDGDECYEFTWVGKKAAMAEAAKPTTKTLRPVKEDSKDWGTTKNLYIEGDNLEVLKILQESYLGKVKMIYIDPPYNTGHDFIYPDSFVMDNEEYSAGTGYFDEDGNINFTRENNENTGKYHSDWCSMMYSRLILARNLLTDDGIIFISIDDNEEENLKKICDQVFGSINFIGTFVINSTPNARDYGHIGKMHEFALFYSKNNEQATTNMIPVKEKTFKYSDDKGGFNVHPLYNSNEAFTNLNRPNLFYPFYLYLNEPIERDFYKIGLTPKDNSLQIYPPKSAKNSIQFVWRWGKEKAANNLNEEIIGYKTQSGEYRIVQKMRHTEKIIRSLLTDTQYSSRRGTAEVESIFENKIFQFPKPLSLLKDFLTVGLGENDTVLDFFSGSGTTAHAVMQLNAEDGGHRKYIMVQLPEPCDEKSDAKKAGYNTICDIGKERIRRSGIIISDEHPGQDIDTGFRVFRLDDSNMKDVYYHPEELDQLSLSDMVSNIKEDRTDMDLLYSCLLDWGVEINLPHTTTILDGCTIHNVDNGALMACFNEKVPASVIQYMAKQQPLRVVFRDSGFAADDAKINVEETFKNFSPDTSVRVL